MTKIRSRTNWTRRPPKDVVRIRGAVKDVFFHYPAISSFPPKEPLENVLRRIQTDHMDVNGWKDIAYNHAVFPDGQLFELRGWGVRGGHTFGHNSTSYALLFMVEINGSVTEEMVEGARQWLREGEALGHISRDVHVQGHREVRPTLCPGESVMEVVHQLEKERWWETGPSVTPELQQAYRDILGQEPTEYAQVWQEKIDLGLLDLNEIRWRLLALRLKKLPTNSGDLVPDKIDPPVKQDEDEIEPEPEPEPEPKPKKKVTKKATKGKSKAS